MKTTSLTAPQGEFMTFTTAIEEQDLKHVFYIQGCICYTIKFLDVGTRLFMNLK